MNNQELKLLIKKLIYQSKYMGCRENDIIFGNFASDNLPGMDAKKIFLYAKLLQHSDTDLLSMVTGIRKADSKYAALIEQIMNYTKVITNG
jgi:succinate dehydrogenase flavin-adding protein (antitoxin of CptAB toxin-antitoxin module)